MILLIPLLWPSGAQLLPLCYRGWLGGDQNGVYGDHMDTNPNYSRRVADAVSVAMEAGDWSEKALAEATGIPRVTLRRRLAGAPFNVAELAAIATTLNTTVSALIGKDAA